MPQHDVHEAAATTPAASILGAAIAGENPTPTGCRGPQLTPHLPKAAHFAIDPK